MNSVLPLAILLTLLVLIVIFLLVFLYLQATRALREQATQQSETMGQTLDIQLRLSLQAQEAATTAQTEASAAASRALAAQQDLLSTILSEAVTSLESNQQKTIQTVDLMATRVIAGLQTFNSQTNSTLASAVALIGAKDPLAYQMIVGGQAAPSQDNVGPYTAVDDVATQQANLANLDAAAKYLENLGVVEHVASSFVGQDS